jgi:hypothetical protein
MNASKVVANCPQARRHQLLQLLILLKNLIQEFATIKLARTMKKQKTSRHLVQWMNVSKAAANHLKSKFVTNHDELSLLQQQ